MRKTKSENKQQPLGPVDPIAARRRKARPSTAKTSMKGEQYFTPIKQVEQKRAWKRTSGKVWEAQMASEWKGIVELISGGWSYRMENAEIGKLGKGIFRRSRQARKACMKAMLRLA